MKIIECQQRSPEWFKMRIGIPTASNFDKIITPLGKPSKQRQKYLYKLVGESITGAAEQSYQNEAMLRGAELEAEARQFYQITTGKQVKEIGFCLADNYGASPDGFVDDDGLIEIKCPTMAMHITYLIENNFPIEYMPQIQGQLLVTGRKWVDFISYYPSIKPFVIRITRIDAFIKSLETELVLFIDELKKLIKKLK